MLVWNDSFLWSGRTQADLSNNRSPGRLDWTSPSYCIGGAQVRGIRGSMRIFASEVRGQCSSFLELSGAGSVYMSFSLIRARSLK
jgi:hypothetical protein